MFASKDIFLKSSGGYQISRSVRLRSSATGYFSRTPASATNRQIFTWSAWVKMGIISGNECLFGAGTNINAGNGITEIGFQTDNSMALTIWQYLSGVQWRITTSAIQRDPSSWYHFVVAVDTTQATSTNRIKIYINGVQQTSLYYSSYPAQNTNTGINTTDAHGIGRRPDGSNLYDGYMTEVNFVDGQALTPSSFGETNAVTGVWQPIKYTGTYGTNGFYLNFSDNSGVTATTIGKDYSGNGNNWTPNNISITAGVTYDSMLDSPTLYADGGNGRGNYAVVNPLSLASSTTLSEANLKGVSSTFNNLQSGTVAVSSGKWYWELTFGGSLGMVGIVPASAPPTTDLGYTATSYGYRSSTGTKYNNGSATAYGNTYTTNDVIGVALDLDNGKLFFSKNNTWQNSGDPAAGTNAAFTGLSGSFMPAAGTPDTTAATWYWNFGQRPFTYTPPTGFSALNTQNLPTPTISKGNQYMDVVLYTGNAVQDRAVTGFGFDLDLAWIKSRNNAGSHVLVNSVVGGDKQLFSNLTNAEQTNSDMTNGFTTGGILVGDNITGTGSTNQNTYTYALWGWNAGGSTVTNTSGSISSQVRANATAGFSVVTFTGTGSAATVGHGLGVAPQMIIAKTRNGVNDWFVYTQARGATKTLYLNLTNAEGTTSAVWNNTAPTSTVFTVGATFSTNTCVAYCFAAVAGYSAFGSYTGNGSANGPFVFTGFRPRWVMIKCYDVAGEHWIIYDTARNTYNVVTNELYANLSNAEATYAPGLLDVTANGFKLRYASAPNASGRNYIYAAFAENPFKLSLAR